MQTLPLLDPKAAGIDVGSETLHVSIAGDTPKVFGTTTGQLHALRVVRDSRFKLYSDGRFFDANADPEEKLPLGPGSSPEAAAAHGKLQRALASLPPDAPPPFPLRSQAVFKLRASEREPGNPKP
jgi:hypothetical protein